MAQHWTFIQICGAIGLVCAAWNLFGDLYLLDFYTAHLSFDQDFAMISDQMQAGKLFSFDNKNQWVVFVAQSGGWMYPVWAFVTAVPLYMGLNRKEEGGSLPWKTAAPCALMVYSLCIVGGALHNAFAFLTALPNVYHYPPAEAAANGWSDLAGAEEFSLFLKTAQKRIVLHLMIGCLPGYVAGNVAGLWVAVLVHFGYANFPRSFNFCNPMFTMFWIQILGMLLPDPWGFYLVGCLGTWGLLVFNMGITYYLWDNGSGLESLSLLAPTEKEEVQASCMDYRSVEHRIT